MINKGEYQDELVGWQEILLSDKSKALALVNLLKKENGVLYAYIEQPILIKPCTDDPSYQLQWHLNSINSPLADIRVEQAWSINKGRNDVIIAVCDGGVDYTHPDLDLGDRSRVIAGYDFGNNDSNPMDDLPDNTSLSFAGHGTHVAGIIGAIANNWIGVSGIMWNCKIMPVKMVGSGSIRYPFGGTILDYSTTALPSDVANAIDYAVNNGAHVINLSYGFSAIGFPIDEVILKIPLLYSTISNAYNRNVVVVAAMGNEYKKGNPIEYPAGFGHKVIAVGNTDVYLQKFLSSNTGTHICVSAPGTDIWSTIKGGGIGTKTGTSMSAPVVSGVAGLIISQGFDRGFNLTNDDVRHILEKTADDITQYGIGFDNETGYGKVNAYRALSLLNAPNELYHGISYGGTTTKTNLSKWIYVGGGSQWGIASGMYFDVDRYVVTKHINFDMPFCSTPTVWIRERESATMSFASPNDGFPYAEITNVNETGFDVKYCTYYVRYNSGGSAINKWVPASISSTKLAYTAVGKPNPGGAAGPVSGPSYVCLSGATFTVDNLPSGCTVSWTPSPNLSPSLASGNPVTFTANGNGTGWVQATINSTACVSLPLPQKAIWVGTPSKPYAMNNFPYDGYIFSGTTEYEFDAWVMDEGITQFEWNVFSGGTLLDGQGSGRIHVLTNTIYNDQPQEFILQVRSNNGCGWSEWLQRSGTVENGISYMMYPNPASENITITINKAFRSSSSAISDNTKSANSLISKAYTVRILDSFGVVKSTLCKTEDSFKIPVDKLLEGVYIVDIFNGKTSYQQRLVIKR